MRSPKTVLENLSIKAKETTYRFKRLYRNLYNTEFYLIAYQKIASTEGSMTAGTDGNTLSGMSLGRIQKIINSLKDHSYQPQPVRRTYIAKKNGKMRPLGIPSSNDKLVQEVVRMLLEAIYEPTFSDKSHGFRPNRSCHTCLTDIKVSFHGAKWIVEGDIKGCFDNIDHHTLISIIRRRVADEAFIELLWKFLRAGYLENWVYNATFSGAPQGSGISPVLSNIYLNELDVFMEGLKLQFDKYDSYRRPSKEYAKTVAKRGYWIKEKKIAVANGDEARIQTATANIKKFTEMVHNSHCYEPIDPSYKKIQYSRYADDFIVGIIGSKRDAESIKEKVGKFLSSELKLILSDEKTKITHSAERIRFLGYDISVERSMDFKYDKNGHFKRCWYGNVKLYMPREKWVNKLLEYDAMYIKKCRDGKEIWKPHYRGKLINWPDAQIVSKYNSEIRGLYNYYRLAGNVAFEMHKFYYLMKVSLNKTFGCKYKTTYKHICNRYLRNGIFTVSYKTKAGIKTLEFYHDGFKKLGKPAPDFVDTLPDYRVITKKRSLIHRMQAGCCELCGATTDDIIMYHVRKLKDLKGETAWEKKMMDIKRKSLAVCPSCFDAITQTNQ